MTIRHTLTLLGLLLAAPLACAQAPQMDMDAMMKWASADLVRYHIVGIYQGKPHIASDGAGRADVSDRVVIDFTWKLSEMKLVGQPTFQNTKSTVTNPVDYEPKCLAPILKGDYEHYELLGIKEGLSGMLEFQVQTSYPVVEVGAVLHGQPQISPAKKETQAEEFVVISPVSFGMPLPDSDELRISKDRKSLIAKKDGWTWTYTPSIVNR